MEEIKVGEYVRSKYGEIGIITKIYPNFMWRKKKNPSILDFNEIVKHSANIIDLIEEGDYVNGRKIERIVEVSDKHNSIIVVYDGELWNEQIKEEDIENIVTHEQFNQVKYEV